MNSREVTFSEQELTPSSKGLKLAIFVKETNLFNKYRWSFLTNFTHIEKEMSYIKGLIITVLIKAYDSIAILTDMSNSVHIKFLNSNFNIIFPCMIGLSDERFLSESQIQLLMRFLPEHRVLHASLILSSFYRLIIFVKKKLFMKSFIRISSASGYFFLLRLGSENSLQHRLLKRR